MTSIRNNRRRYISIPLQRDFFTLIPGLTLNVTDEICEIIKTHPKLRTYLESGKLEILNRIPPQTGEIASLPVSDDRSGQPEVRLEMPDAIAVSQGKKTKAIAK